MKLYLFIINFFILTFFSSNNLSAGNQPFCNGNFLYIHKNFKNTYKIEYIKIDVLKNKQFQKNNIRMLINNKHFIHSSGYVKINSIVETDNNFDNILSNKIYGVYRYNK